MKKILLTIFIIIFILSVNVLAVDIDIGYPAIDRESSLTGVRTAIMTGNPANATGTITTVEVWAAIDMTLAEVATFYRPNPGSYPNKLTTRDWEPIGTVTAGSKQTFTVSLDVQVGDYIGIKWQGGSIKRYITGGDGFWHDSSDQIPCTNHEFSFGVNWIASLYGYSAAEEEEINVLFFGTNF